MSHSPCFDACKSINPNNPEKVAETLPEIFELLQVMSDYYLLDVTGFAQKHPQYANNSSSIIFINISLDAKHLIEKATGTQPF